MITGQDFNNRILYPAAAAECFQRFPDLRMVELTPEVVEDWEKSWKPLQKHGGNDSFNWAAIADEIADCQDDLDPFGFALYMKDTLCALVAGHVRLPLDEGSSINIETIQGSPVPSHPLKGFVVKCTLDLAEAIAVEEGLEQVIVHKPIAETVAVYRNRDYTLHRSRKNTCFTKNFG